MILLSVCGVFTPSFLNFYSVEHLTEMFFGLVEPVLPLWRHARFWEANRRTSPGRTPPQVKDTEQYRQEHRHGFLNIGIYLRLVFFFDARKTSGQLTLSFARKGLRSRSRRGSQRPTCSSVAGRCRWPCSSWQRQVSRWIKAFCLRTRSVAQFKISATLSVDVQTWKPNQKVFLTRGTSGQQWTWSRGLQTFACLFKRLLICCAAAG